MNKLYIQPIKKSWLIKNNGMIVSDKIDETFFVQDIRLPKFVVIAFYNRILALSYHSYIFNNVEIILDNHKDISTFVNSTNNFSKRYFCFKFVCNK